MLTKYKIFSRINSKPTGRKLKINASANEVAKKLQGKEADESVSNKWKWTFSQLVRLKLILLAPKRFYLLDIHPKQILQATNAFPYRRKNFGIDWKSFISIIKGRIPRAKKYSCWIGILEANIYSVCYDGIAYGELAVFCWKQLKNCWWKMCFLKFPFCLLEPCVGSLTNESHFKVLIIISYYDFANMKF